MANGLTDAQRRTLFATIRDAAREQGEEPEAYRKRVMADELGVAHLSQVSRGSGYDTLMARICRDAGDDAGALKYALATTARLRRLITEAAALLAPGNPLGYIAGVMIQSHTVRGYDVPDLTVRLASETGWLDLSVPQLRNILAMLKTHLRRQSP